MNRNFWKNKKVLITGHTGFKGSWLTLILNFLGAKTVGYAIDPISKPNFFDGLNLNKYLVKDFRNNIKNLNKLKSVIKSFKPSIVFHMAAQSSVLVSYKNPVDTIESNVVGTMNILEAINSCKTVRSAIIVTTDKVYLNLEKKIKFDENSSLGGHDLYSGSKAACEIITQSYRKSFFSKKNKCKIATVRSGNCIGGGDWTKDRIIKDCVESFLLNKRLVIRSPKASRPWQHVIEPLFGYLKLAERLYKDKKNKNVGSWNFGPNKKNNMKVIDVAKFGKKIFNSKSKILITKQKFYESRHLSLNSAKANRKLKWKIILSSKEALKLTFDWYKFYYRNKNKNKIVNLSFDQINFYFNKMLRKKNK